MRCLVTAGNTREMIDQVRDWGNVFTGNTGFAIAKALKEKGDVDLLTSNRQHISEASELRIDASGFQTHAQLKASLASLMGKQKYDAVFMAAAVSDYRPEGTYVIVNRKKTGKREEWIVEDVQDPKIKSVHPEIAIVGRPTEKIVDLFRSEWGFKGILVKFKLEVGISKDRLLEVGEASRRASKADYLVANTLDMVTGDAAGAYLLSDGCAEWVVREALPARMAQLVSPCL